MGKTGQICKSTVKSQYGLKDSELENFDSVYVRNPHYRSAAPMELFEEEDIKAWCDAHADMLRARQQKKEDRAAKIIENRKIREAKAKPARDAREKELGDALAAKGLKISDNEKFWEFPDLCDDYIDGSSNHSVAYIVREMCILKYLHDVVGDEYDKEIDSHCEGEKEFYGYFPKGCSREGADYARGSFKRKMPGGEWPEVWPWENRANDGAAAAPAAAATTDNAPSSPAQQQQQDQPSEDAAAPSSPTSPARNSKKRASVSATTPTTTKTPTKKTPTKTPKKTPSSTKKKAKKEVSSPRQPKAAVATKKTEKSTPVKKSKKATSPAPKKTVAAPKKEKAAAPAKKKAAETKKKAKIASKPTKKAAVAKKKTTQPAQKKATKKSSPATKAKK